MTAQKWPQLCVERAGGREMNRADWLTGWPISGLGALREDGMERLHLEEMAGVCREHKSRKKWQGNPVRGAFARWSK